MAKLFLLDAYALIYRSYYAFLRAPRINSKGLNTSAVMGFCNTLHEVLQKEQPDYLGVAFDHGKTFRHEAYPDYKAQREETPEDIRASVPIIKDILGAMRIPVLQADGFEADDVIGTLATRAAEQGIDTYMLTPDKDYAQLVRENVRMYRPRHGGGYEVMGEQEVCAKYGIASTAQVIDLLALMGDSSDNYPGCPGVGEKTAVKLIGEFENVEGLLANTDKLKGKMREKVKAAVDDIRTSYFLATIRTDVPLPLDLDALKVGTIDEARLSAIFADLEFKTMASKFLGHPAKPSQPKAAMQLSLFDDPSPLSPQDNSLAPRPSSLSSLATTPHDYRLVETEEDARQLAQQLSSHPLVSMDTETTSTHAVDAELVGLSFAVEEHAAFYVAIPAVREQAQRMVDIFRPLYEDEHITKVGQNIKYDIEVLANYGISVAGPLFDTMLAHYIIQPELHHNMDYMAETLLHYQTIHIDELIGPRGKAQRSMRDLQPAEVYEYACEDADITLQLKNLLEPRLSSVGGESLFRDIEMPLIPVLADMEMTGVRLDTDTLAETSRLFAQRLQDYERKIYEQAGEQFNISSPKQVGEILFGKMQIMDKPKKTKTGQYVTSEEVLQSLAAKAPIVADILAYRGLKKLLGTYVDALPKLINERTGHIHTSFNQAVTATGRLSSSDPNLQNIPVRDDDGREIRKCFIPEPGCLFFSADYSQIELRIMAHLSADEHMLEAFQSGQDIHAATAAKIWKKQPEEVTADERKKAKQANFGIIYGITTFGLAQRMGIANGEARQLIDDYFATFPKVRQYIEHAKEQARQNGYAETLFGRRRYLPDISSRNATVRGFAERNAVNAPIQGSEADIIKVAMLRIHRRFQDEHLRSKMILQVHDELNFSVLPDERDRVEQIVIEEMQGAANLSVPLKADFGWGSNWLEAH